MRLPMRPRRHCPAWSSMPAPARGNILYKAAEILEKKFDQLGAEMTREEGKTLPEAKGEVRRAINIFRYFGGEGSRLNGVMVPSRARPRPYVRHPQTDRRGGPGDAVEFSHRHSGVEDRARADLRQYGGGEAGVGVAAHARGALSKLCMRPASRRAWSISWPGRAANWAQALVNAKPLKAISFTGSCEVGNWLHAEASKRRLRIQLEMGGKNPTIVLADADFNAAVENVVNAAFFSTGQKCTATSRAIVEDAHLRPVRRRAGGAHEEAEGRRRDAAGHRHRPGVDEAALDTVLKYIEIGRKECGRAEVRRQSADGRRPMTKGISSSRPFSPMCARSTPSRAKRFSDRCWP